MRVAWCLVTALAGKKARSFLRHICPVDVYRPRVPPSTLLAPSIEHVVPQKWMRNKKDRNDAINLFVCSAPLNHARGCKRLGSIPTNEATRRAIDATTGCDAGPVVGLSAGPDYCVVMNGCFEPPLRSRGPLARTCLDVMDKYPHMRSVIYAEVMRPETLREWLLYPTEPWEVARAKVLGLTRLDTSLLCAEKAI